MFWLRQYEVLPLVVKIWITAVKGTPMDKVSSQLKLLKSELS